MIEYTKKVETINAEKYSTTLRRLRDAIKEKGRGKLAKKLLLLHNNAPVHTAWLSKAAVLECGFEEINHPPYIPDLAPSDYLLFPNLKKDLQRKRFADNNELKSIIRPRRKLFFQIEKLISRSNKCIDIMGDYIEK